MKWRLIALGGLVVGTIVVPAPHAAHAAATYDTTGDAWSLPLLVGCRTRARATVTATGSSRTVDWYTSASCDHSLVSLSTTMIVSSGWPLNVVQGPRTASCTSCTFVQQAGTYTSSASQLHYLTGGMTGHYAEAYVYTPPVFMRVGVWTPAPLVPCTPTVFNNVPIGHLDCATNTNYIT